jgi:hypothetical protein
VFERQSLGSTLEAALVRVLGATWDEINQNHFRGRLRRPVIALHDGRGRLGQWMGATRTLSLSRALVCGPGAQPWGVVREVLKHEIAHQFVDEVLGVDDQSAHGPAFENVCRQHGFDAAATGIPGLAGGDGEGEGAGAPQPPAVLRRIARLLALAESPNLHEAEAAMKQAQRLMLRYNIEAAGITAERGFSFRHLGHPRRRIDAAEQVLAGILADHFFVEVIWVPSYLPVEGREGRVLEVCGTVANLEVATWVHGFLLETAARLWRDHKRAHGVAGDRERRRYVLGVMMGFDDKLGQAAAENRVEGLIWRGDPELDGYLRRRYPRRAGGGRIGYRRTAAYEHGRRAGQSIILYKPVQAAAERPSGGARGRLLPAR